MDLKAVSGISSGIWDSEHKEVLKTQGVLPGTFLHNENTQVVWEKTADCLINEGVPMLEPTDNQSYEAGFRVSEVTSGLTLDFQCHDGGSLLTRIDHHGN